jgi:hypothetical protein
LFPEGEGLRADPFREQKDSDGRNSTLQLKLFDMIPGLYTKGRFISFPEIKNLTGTLPVRFNLQSSKYNFYFTLTFE